MIGLAMMASATFVTATELNTLCMSKKADDQLVRTYYIIGAVDGIHTGAMAVDPSKDNDRICLPVGTLPQDVVDLVKAYLRESKLDHHVDAPIFVFAALDTKWRCPAPKS
jgi:hypothetical protein